METSLGIRYDMKKNHKKLVKLTLSVLDEMYELQMIRSYKEGRKERQYDK